MKEVGRAQNSFDMIFRTLHFTPKDFNQGMIKADVGPGAVPVEVWSIGHLIAGPSL